MRYLGEWVIPVAAIILLLAVEFPMWEALGDVGRFLKRLVERVLLGGEESAPWKR